MLVLLTLANFETFKSLPSIAHYKCNFHDSTYTNMLVLQLTFGGRHFNKSCDLTDHTMKDLISVYCEQVRLIDNH